MSGERTTTEGVLMRAMALTNVLRSAVEQAEEEVYREAGSSRRSASGTSDRNG